MSIVKQLKSDQKGQGLVEYGLIFALVSVVAVGALNGVGDKVSDTFETVRDAGIQAMILDGYVPIASVDELSRIREGKKQTIGQGTKWEGFYEFGLNKKYVLVSDINFNEVDSFTPIGDIDHPFTGKFDGGGYKIKNLSVNYGDNAGLFGYADGSTFNNVLLENVDVLGDKHVGGLVGFQIRSSILNSSMTGTVSGSQLVGGLAGRQDSSVMSNSYAKGDVSVTGHFVGGLAGSQNASTIINSYAMGDIDGLGSYSGGLVGNQNGLPFYGGSKAQILNSYFVGNVTGVSFVGGLTGHQTEASTMNSYVIGDVIGSEYVGGLIGHQITSSLVKNSYAAGRVDGVSYVGGLLGGQSDSSQTIHSYYNTELSGMSDKGKGDGKSSAEMSHMETYTDWDFTNVWELSGIQLPLLR